MIRRFAVLGDIHTEDRRLEAALRSIAEARVDVVLSVGDVVDGPGDVDRTIELLELHGVIAVRGNHDRWILNDGFIADEGRLAMGWNVRWKLKPASLRWLKARPVMESLATVAGQLLLCHGVGEDDMTKLYEVDPDPWSNDELREIVESGRHKLVVCGHTHERWITRFSDVLWLNAGTLSTRGIPGFLVVDLSEGYARFFDVAEDGSVTAASLHLLREDAG